LRGGDEQAFRLLVTLHQTALLRTAERFVGDIEAAREVVQETWMGFLSSLERFEGRSSVKTWLFRILVNKAKTRRLRDRRTVPFSRLVHAESAGDATMHADCFTGPDDPAGAGHWRQGPAPWRESPESLVMNGETMRIVKEAIELLPEAQGMVMFLRDIQGLTADEVCRALGVTPGNQRVLLHRARTRTRAAISRIFGNAI
jgi:RNA polymerase sigma-70 factor (ECF subfamily)